MENKYKYQAEENVDRVNRIAIDFLNKQYINKEQPIKVLQLGCNEGYNLAAIKDSFKNSYTVGIDILDVEPVEGVDEFYQTDLEKDSLSFLGKYFDVILLLDVLEHLTQPKKLLSICKNLLNDDGVIIASIPNLMHFSTLGNLILNGNFKYTTTGLLDYDHKHLFTYNEIGRMFSEEGYISDIFSFKIKESLTFQKRHFIHQLQSIKYLPEFQYTTFSYYVVAKLDKNKNL